MKLKQIKANCLGGWIDIHTHLHTLMTYGWQIVTSLVARAHVYLKGGFFRCLFFNLIFFFCLGFFFKCLWHCVCDTGGHRCVLLCTHVPKKNYCMHKTGGIAESFHWTQFTPKLQITLSSFINITKPWIHSWETFLDLQQSWEAETLCTVLHWERSYMYSKRVSAFTQKWPLHA